MALDLIEVGTVPNDGTGDTNRGAWEKTNSMFTELYGLLSGGGFVLEVDFDTAIGDLNTTIADLTTVVGTKIDIDDLEGATIRKDTEQTNTAAEKRQFAANSGLSVVLQFEILPEGEALAGVDLSMVLPRLPFGLVVLDVRFTAKDVLLTPADLADYEVDATIKGVDPDGTETTLAEAINEGFSPEGGSAIGVIAADDTFTTQKLVLAVAIARPHTVGGELKGLVLWLRGIWTE